MKRRLMFMPLLLLPAAASHAADNGFYLGAGISQSDYDLPRPGSLEPFDDEDNGFKIIVGWRPLDSFGIEATYVDHGEAVVPLPIACPAVVGAPCPSQLDVSAKTAAAFAVGYLDLPLVDLFAKAGAASWRVEGRGPSSIAGFSFDEDDLDFAWGGGVQARLGSLAARLEYEQIRVLEDQDLGTISLSVTWTFL